VIFGLVVYQLVNLLIRYIRTIACLNNDTQRYFAAPNVLHGNFKRYFWDAPLFRLRHHREFKLSAAVNIGTLPNRGQTVFLVGYLAMNIALMVVGINWNAPAKAMLKDLVTRSGRLSVMNMIPLFLIAGRNNPLIKWCGITFDTFNLVHRWIGRVVVFEAVIHTVAWIVSKVQVGQYLAASVSEYGTDFGLAGWSIVGKAIGSTGSMPQTGLIVMQTVFSRCSAQLTDDTGNCGVRRNPPHVPIYLPSRILRDVPALAYPLRCRGPRCRLVSHQAPRDLERHSRRRLNLGHRGKPLPRPHIRSHSTHFSSQRSIRLATIIYRNLGRGGTKAEVEILPGDALRVTLKIARPWAFRPGQHAYIYLPAIGWWTSHPFSLAWSEECEDVSSASSEKGLVMTRQDVLDMRRTSMSLIVRRRTGFTEQLYRRADASPSGKFATSAVVEGPYGAQNHHAFGTVLLFAAGVGITHQVPHVRDLVTGFSNGTVAARKVVLVWIIQSPEHLEWIRPWMTTILSLPRRREVLKILLFVTRPRSTKEIHSPSASVQMFPGRPNVQALVDAEVENRVGGMGVSVCGTGGLADDVRRATRRWMGRANVEFVEESFSW